MDGIDLHVPQGSVYGLLGPNGAGKTTAIRAITTLLPIAPGMVRVFGRDPARGQMGVRRIIAQSAMFIAIFHGIQIIWERDADVLT